MTADGKGERGNWVWICIGIVGLLALVTPFAIPYFATKPESKEGLTNYLTPPPPPPPPPTPSPAATPRVKKR